MDSLVKLYSNSLIFRGASVYIGFPNLSFCAPRFLPVALACVLALLSLGGLGDDGDADLWTPAW